MNIIWGAIPDPDETFTVEVNGVQWEWEYRYRDGLTWEDPSSTFDVSWGDDLRIMADGNYTANVIQGTNSWSLELIDGTITNDSLFNDVTNSSVTITDADGNTVHTWAHIPEGQLMTKHFFIPCDENVMFNIHSDKYGDKNGVYQGVQHAFWLQEWGNKEDAVPGLDTGTWLYVQPNEAGTFPVRCAEYCGEYHSVMTGTVKVVAREGTSCDDIDFGVVFDNKMKEA
jgi:heme/copper-type cytochrome/quinol oxidase subunit 2